MNMIGLFVLRCVRGRVALRVSIASDPSDDPIGIRTIDCDPGDDPIGIRAVGCDPGDDPIGIRAVGCDPGVRGGGNGYEGACCCGT